MNSNKGLLNDSKKFILILTIISGLTFGYTLLLDVRSLIYGLGSLDIFNLVIYIVSIFYSSSFFVYFLLLLRNSKEQKKKNLNEKYLITTYVIYEICNIIEFFLNIQYMNFSSIAIKIISIILIGIYIYCFAVIFSKNQKNNQLASKILVTLFSITVVESIYYYITGLTNGFNLLYTLSFILNTSLYVLLIIFFYNYKTYYNNLFNKEQENITFKFELFEWIACISVAIVFLVIVLFIVPSLDEKIKSKSNETHWSDLTDEEKERYERNFGNGKSEEYDKAIEDYQKNHR